MDTTVLVSSLITGAVSLIICIINGNSNQKKSDNEQDKRMMEIQATFNQSIAIIDCKMENLTSEVREHNNFAKRMPVVEEQIKVINHRLEDLERKTM